MSDLVRWEIDAGVAVVSMDDGKANAVGPALVDGLHRALDAAEKEARAAVLVGRAGRFSGGFDLSVMGQGGDAARDLVKAGAGLCLRLLELPLPVVAACTGHAIAAGALLVLSCDYRLGARGGFRIGLNETAIGLPLPHFAQRIAALRLSRRHLARAMVQAELYDPDSARDAGYLDATSDPETLLADARDHAARLAELDSRAFTHSKRAWVAEAAEDIRDRLDDDLAALLPAPDAVR